MVTKRERYLGAMVGVLAGDALLAPYETWRSDRVAKDLMARSGLVPFEYDDPWREGKRFPPGRPTDDSDQTAALAESLIICGKLNEEDLFYRLRRIVFEKKSPLWDQPAYGAGSTTKKMLRPASWAESRLIPTEEDFPSNGSLMRSTPMALFFGSRAKSDPQLTRRMSEVTHRHPEAVACCNVYVAVLVSLLEGRSVGQAFASGYDFALPGDIAALLQMPGCEPRDPEEWPGRGAALLTLHIALWSLLHSRDFREGLTKVAMIGGDTDTYGAVAGGLLGAYHGIDGIPAEWRKALIGRAKMEFLADKLYGMAH